MKRKLLLVLAFIALPGVVNALGLGKLQLNSALNQPFDARIELLSTSASELDSLNVGLADGKAFHRAGIDRPFILAKLKFEVMENANGADYIQISSRDAIREPFLNFLLEASWSTGRLYREYTVLLDPPLYDPNAKRSARSSDNYTPAPAPQENYGIDEGESNSMQAAASTGSYSGSEYGPTSESDTLWSIAKQVRPDSSVSIQQMMLALLRSNPDAFLNNNINGLKRGQILNMPATGDIRNLSLQEAIAEVRQQNSSWQELRGMVAEAVPATAAVEGSATVGGKPAVTEGNESELRLVAPASTGTGAGQGTGEGVTDASAELALANEKIETVSQENADLRDRVQESETIIEDLKRLIALKDNELAEMQQKIAAAGSAGEQVEAGEAGAEQAVEEETATAEGTTTAVAEEEAATTTAATESETAEAMEVAPEPGAEEPAAVEQQQAAPAPTRAAPPPAAGMLDQVLGYIMGNLMVIAAALGGLIVVIVLILFVSRRKQRAAVEAPVAATTEFPDFDDSETDTVIPAADAETAADMAVDESEEETVLPDTDAAAGDKTEFIPPPAAQEEPASAAAPAESAEPEEDLLAEVNVFLAYEHFDQAEEFVREAIAGSPDNLEFHTKLLEVFYAASDKKKYEEAAQVLHDMVNGEGPHWEMAKAMWQEMSPNRALFEEGADDTATAPAAETAGGIVDITAEETATDSADASIDFDLGMGGAEDAAETGAEAAEDVLDITAAGDDEGILDVTVAAGVDTSSADEDLLDVTAAVGLETAGEAVEIEDIAAAAEDEQILDITAGSDETSADDADVLDISHGSGEDLLDVTANANLEAEGIEEDLLDVTSSGGAEADGEELLEIPAAEPVAEDHAVDFDIGGLDSETEGEAEGVDTGPTDAAMEPASDDNSVDFDIGGIDIEPPADAEVEPAAAAADDNIIDFDVGGAGEEGGTGLDLESDAAVVDDSGIELDLNTGDVGEVADEDLKIVEEVPADTSEAGIEDIGGPADEGLEIDLSIDDADLGDSADIGDVEIDSGDTATTDDLAIDLTLEDEAEDNKAESSDAGLGIDLDLEIEEDTADTPEIDMEGTVEMPRLDMDDMGIEIDEEEDDDDDDHTVFVPRAGAADEQTAEDEIATKLDLAKAYVELGDKDSARGILDEVLAEGSDEQKQAAQELIKQLD